MLINNSVQRALNATSWISAIFGSCAGHLPSGPTCSQNAQVGPHQRELQIVHMKLHSANESAIIEGRASGAL